MPESKVRESVNHSRSEAENDNRRDSKDSG